MRVIGGRLGGLIFEDPRGHRTHPMSDKARGALFNSLGDITGMTVLDTYSGTGALSIEAISRGATSALAIDVDIEAVKTISASVNHLGLEENITVRRKNISGWSRNHQQDQFDLVFA